VSIAPTAWTATEDNIGGHKVEDRVQMFRNASGHDGENGTVRALDRDHGWRVWVHPDRAPYGLAVRMDPDDLERIVLETSVATITDATPAPLDPANVKAGDMVTVRVVEGRNEYDVHGKAWEPAWEPVYGLSVGNVSLTAPNVTLIAHQPAPEPEPEWKPGTVWVDERGVRYLAGSNGSGSPRLYAADGAFVIPGPDTDVRPLVVIDPADVDVDALAKVWNGVLDKGTGLSHGGLSPLGKSALRAVLAELGLAEVSR